MDRRRSRGWVAALAFLTALAATSCDVSEEAPRGPYATIRFVDLGGIDDWRATDDDGLLIKGTNGRWYRATFYGPCSGLRFAETIGFVTDATRSLDRFSSILVRDERCYFKTFDAIPSPDVPGGTPSEPREPDAGDS